MGNRGVFSSILPLIYLNYCCCYLLSVSYGIFYFEALSGPIVTCLQFCSCGWLKRCIVYPLCIMGYLLSSPSINILVLLNVKAIGKMREDYV